MKRTKYLSYVNGKVAELLKQKLGVLLPVLRYNPINIKMVLQRNSLPGTDLFPLLVNFLLVQSCRLNHKFERGCRF